MTTLKITLLTSVIIMAFVVSCKTQSVSDISTNQWKEDIDYLVSKMAALFLTIRNGLTAHYWKLDWLF